MKVGCCWYRCSMWGRGADRQRKAKGGQRLPFVRYQGIGEHLPLQSASGSSSSTLCPETSPVEMAACKMECQFLAGALGSHSFQGHQSWWSWTKSIHWVGLSRMLRNICLLHLLWLGKPYSQTPLQLPSPTNRDSQANIISTPSLRVFKLHWPMNLQMSPRFCLCNWVSTHHSAIQTTKQPPLHCCQKISFLMQFIIITLILMIDPLKPHWNQPNGTHL